MCQFYKRLDRVSSFPAVGEGAKTVAVDEHILDDLLDGIDVEPGRRGRHSTNEIR